MEEENGLYQKVTLPLDEEGFTKSFNLDHFDEKEVAQFFDEYGVVIFNDVVNEDSIEKTIDEIWIDIQNRCGKEHDRNDQKTWTFQGWRGAYGFVNGLPLRYHQMCKNRQNPKVYKAFKTLYEISSGKALDQPLIAMFDRGSGMRPGFEHPQWITRSIYHFDINPWWWTQVVKTTRKEWRTTSDYVPEKFAKWLSEGNKLPFNGYTKLAGVLALSDTNETSGGFECVCGFQKWIKKWCESTPPNTQISADQNLMSLFQKVYQRKGSLLLFTRELPHNIYQNHSKNWRYAQYLRMSPLSALMLTEFQRKKRRECVLHFLPKDLNVDDPISKQIYMLDQ